MSNTLELTQQLIRCASITPEDAGCQDIMMQRLDALGFHSEALPFAEVQNFWARRGSGAPLFVFAGHTDVVPPGPLREWSSDPFVPSIRHGYLYGRGAADMKASLAAMVIACERFVRRCPNHRGSIAFLVTSDEEGPAKNGTCKVVETLQQRGEHIDWCLVGEPSSDQQLGDTIKNGRRGSLSGRLVITGIQGHVAYPHQVQNPIHALGAMLTALADEVWDHGNPFFPPTSFQITSVQAGTGAGNVVPGSVELRFNFRFSTELSVAAIQQRVKTIIDTQILNEEVKRAYVFGYKLDWELSGMPFLTKPGELVEAAVAAISAELERTPELSTSGGTSDGRFIAPTGAQVLELGPLNQTIHKIDECVAIADLEPLSRIYEGILNRLLG